MTRLLIFVLFACGFAGFATEAKDNPTKVAIVGHVLARQFGVADLAPISQGQEWVQLIVRVAERHGPSKYVRMIYTYWPADKKGLPFENALTKWHFDATRDTSCDSRMGDVRFIKGVPDSSKVKPSADERIPALVPLRGLSKEQLEAVPDSTSLPCYTVRPEDVKLIP